jgi:Cdc6-like AAA superfamily ATPase
MIDVIFQPGQHAILYGDRGVGKTSLSNILKEKIFTSPSSSTVIKRSCTTEHNFKLIWQHVFSDYDIDGESAVDILERRCNPFDVYQILAKLPPTTKLIVIIDEFDRVNNSETKILMADTIKYFSDYGCNATVIVVGVADSVSALFAGHESITRCAEQIPVPRMAPDELTQIIEKRLAILGMTMNEKVRMQIVKLSQGFPGYTHLLGQTAVRSAIQRKSTRINDKDFAQAMKIAIEKSDETITNHYLRAVRSTKPKNQYKEALLACALAETDSRGYFSAAAVRDPFSVIMRKSTDIPNFARHLQEFCDPSRGPTLIREGKPKSFEYRFSDPLLRPYVLIRGLREGLTPEDLA